MDALLTRMATDSTESTETPLLDVPDPSLPASESTTVPAVVEAAPPTSVDDTSSDAGPETVNVTPDPPQEPASPPSPVLRRSTRHRPPPERYGLSRDRES